MEEEEGKVLVAAPLSPLALPHQPKRHDVPLGDLVADGARQVALSVEVRLIEWPLEDQGKERGRVVAHLILSMSMDQVLHRVGRADVLLATPTSP